MYSTHDGENILAINARGPQEVEHARSVLIYGVNAALYKIYNEELVPRDASEVAQILSDQAAEQQARIDRLEGIIAAQEASDLKEITIEQATTYIENKLDLTDLDATAPDVQSATTIAALRTALWASLVEVRKLIINIEAIEKAEVPYILK